MPKYSPELSPAELVHNGSKKHVREHQREYTELYDAIIDGHEKITCENMRGYYNHTLDYFNREYPIVHDYMQFDEEMDEIYNPEEEEQYDEIEDLAQEEGETDEEIDEGSEEEAERDEVPV